MAALSALVATCLFAVGAVARESSGRWPSPSPGKSETSP